MPNDPILQFFLAEIRAAEKTGHSAAELEPFFDKLEGGADQLNIELFDGFRQIARRQSPLSERLKACCELLQKTVFPVPPFPRGRRLWRLRCAHAVSSGGSTGRPE
jgi:hypothetical protein